MITTRNRANGRHFSPEMDQEMDHGSRDHTRDISRPREQPCGVFLFFAHKFFDPLSVGLQSRWLKERREPGSVTMEQEDDPFSFSPLSSALSNSGDGNALWFGPCCHSVLHDGAQPHRACRVT